MKLFSPGEPLVVQRFCLRNACLRNIFFVALLIWIPFFSQAIQIYSLEDFYLKHPSLLKLVSSRGLVLEIECVNIYQDSLVIIVQPGDHFNSDEKGIQNVMILHDTCFTVQPGDTSGVMVRGYCTQRKNKCPYQGATYWPDFTKKEYVSDFTQLIDSCRYPAWTLQEACWILLDDHSMHGIPQTPKTIPLLQQLSRKTGKEIPEYAVRYSECSDPRLAYTDNKDSLFLYVTYQTKASERITIVMLDDRDCAVYSPMSGKLHKAGKHYLNDVLFVKYWRRGKYSLKIYGNGELKKNKEISI